jgi:hypothetical protein
MTTRDCLGDRRRYLSPPVVRRGLVIMPVTYGDLLWDAQNSLECERPIAIRTEFSLVPVLDMQTEADWSIH